MIIACGTLTSLVAVALPSPARATATAAGAVVAADGQVWHDLVDDLQEAVRRRDVARR